MSQVAMRRQSGPVLKVTKYDLVTASLIAMVVGLVVGVAALIVIWLTNRIPLADVQVPVEILEMPGGSPDGAPDETLLVESPDPETDDPSVADEISEEQELMEMLDNVMEVSDQATQVAQEQFETASKNSGKPGSASGTGRRPLGMGNGKSGFPREQRWFTRFADKNSLAAYARQLDYFNIELGALMPDGTLNYLSNLSTTPKVRKTRSGKAETRLYMIWQGGDRRKADLELFQSVGIDASEGLNLHFYPKATEQMLLKIERDFAGRPVKEIRRTYFFVRPAGNGYEFAVERQLYVR